MEEDRVCGIKYSLIHRGALESQEGGRFYGRSSAPPTQMPVLSDWRLRMSPAMEKISSLGMLVGGHNRRFWVMMAREAFLSTMLLFILGSHMAARL